jgi:hypothetical protein
VTKIDWFGHHHVTVSAKLRLSLANFSYFFSMVGNMYKILEFKSNQFVLFLYGHDTTSAAIYWAPYLLGLHLIHKNFV